MVMKYFTSGFLVKLITGFDDSLTHIPLMTYLTQTKKGKIAFGIGIFMAICLAIIFAVFFSSVLRLIPNYRYIMAGLLVVLALVIGSGVLEKHRKKKVLKKKRISNKRFFKLVGFGFVAAFMTVIDDTVAYSSVFLGTPSIIAVVLGILSATILQIFLIIYFSKKLTKLKFRKELSGLALIILAIAVGLGWL